MPVNNKWGVNEAVDAMKNYALKTGRRVSYEYTLIAGVNDSKECANELCGLLRGSNAHVNLIPVNTVAERNNKRSDFEHINLFCNILKSKGINATIRRTLGSDINASCGQLRRNRIGGNDCENCCENR